MIAAEGGGSISDTSCLTNFESLESIHVHLYILQYSVLVRDVHSAELAERTPMQHTTTAVRY